MRCKHFYGLDNRNARRGKLLLLAVRKPAGGCLVDRFLDLLTLQLGQLVVFHERQNGTGAQHAGINPHALNADAIIVLLEGRVVGHPDRWQHEAIFFRNVAADFVYAALKTVLADQDQVHEVRRNFQVDFVSMD